MAGRLQDKVAVITGATSGIGAATVRRFVRREADIAAPDGRQVVSPSEIERPPLCP